MSTKDLKSLKNRIESVLSTTKITKVMKMIAFAKLRSAKEKFFYADNFYEKLITVIANLDTKKYYKEYIDDKSQEYLYLVFSSNRGLCGSYNSSVQKIVQNKYNEDIAKGKKISTIFIGNKSAEYFINTRHKITRNFYEVWENKDPEYYFACDILHKVLSLNNFKQVYLFYNRLKTGISFDTVRTTLFACKNDIHDIDSYGDNTKFMPNKKYLAKDMFLEFLSAKIYTILTSSYAAENVSRMMAMDNATNNAQEISKDLKKEFNTLRQEKITNEIMEIISGSE